MILSFRLLRNSISIPSAGVAGSQTTSILAIQLDVITRAINPQRLRAEVVVVGEDHGLGASPDAQLVEEVGDVVAHRLFADRETRCDLGVSESFRNQSQHFALAWR